MSFLDKEGLAHLWNQIIARFNSIDYPVDSVNGKTGDIQLAASDVGARPNTWLPTIEDIDAAPAGYGLGETAWKSGSADDLTETGVYGFSNGEGLNPTTPFVSIGDIVTIGRSADIATQIGIEHQYGRPDFVVRKRNNEGWTSWLHINPRMLLNTEYLINENWLGGKFVYVKAVGMGALADSGNTIAVLGTDITPISFHGIAYNDDYVCDLSAYSGVDDVYYKAENGYLVVHSVNADAANYNAIVVVKYTKN